MYLEDPHCKHLSSNLLVLVYSYTARAIPALSMTLPGQHGLLYHLPEYQLFSTKKKKLSKCETSLIRSHLVSHSWDNQNSGFHSYHYI